EWMQGYCAVSCLCAAQALHYIYSMLVLYPCDNYGFAIITWIEHYNAAPALPDYMGVTLQ
ncbi:MAG: hypothetical protein ABFS22_07010, partial [Pseudomonadota bacterium]